MPEGRATGQAGQELGGHCYWEVPCGARGGAVLSRHLGVVGDGGHAGVRGPQGLWPASGDSVRPITTPSSVPVGASVWLPS